MTIVRNTIKRMIQRMMKNDNYDTNADNDSVLTICCPQCGMFVAQTIVYDMPLKKQENVRM